MDNPQNSIKRRSVLSTGTTVATAAAFPLVLTNKGYAYTNDPKDKPNATIGVNVPITGPYSEEGEDQLNAYKLAIKHINGEGDGGMLKTLQPLSLTGNGINGKKLDMVIGDTRTKKDVAVRSAESMVKNDGALMITGGSSSGVAIAVQDYCQEAGVIFMASATNSNDTTGKNRRRNGYRHYLNAYMSAAAMAPVLEKNYGSDRNAYYLTVDYNWGHSIEATFKQFMGSVGWSDVGSALTPLSNPDFTDALQVVKDSDADFLVLNQFGADLVKVLKQANEIGLFDAPRNGKNFQVAVPLHSRLAAVAAGDAMKGVFGTMNWHWTLQDPGSQAFLMSFGKEYGYPPSQGAHCCYVQTLLWANACQMAGTFDPCAVAEALEGFEYSGTGDIDAQYRKDDHQCMKGVIVAQGKISPVSKYDLLEVVSITPKAQVEFDPSKSLFAGDLGSCNSGS